MKRLLITAAAIALLSTPAMAKDMYDCNETTVQEALKRITHATTIIETKNIPSEDVENSRFCKSEILAANGALLEIVYELRWTSASEGRFWLQTKGGRVL